MKYLMTFSYDGSEFKGYQKQIEERKYEEERANWEEKLTLVENTGTEQEKTYEYSIPEKYKLNLDDTCDSFRLGSSEGKIDFIDPAGGPFMSVGGLCEEFVIDNIKIDNNEYYITFK